ncbi:hypothetical protein SGFS_043400 [Streptomyces graminofaciens]|uniref:Uncharacterized protein n=1 Tax=Streptomyces graminofaciens TaxID=68212 RepID=A0ABM7FAN4_9ACTN|nr:hypothetical protein SGFS_043400 [Streptomyces graminofaciens]
MPFGTRGLSGDGAIWLPVPRGPGVVPNDRIWISRLVERPRPGNGRGRFVVVPAAAAADVVPLGPERVGADGAP